MYSYHFTVNVDFEGIWLPLLMGAFAMPFYSQFKWTIIAKSSDI
jgi:hypothetical protein